MLEALTPIFVFLIGFSGGFVGAVAAGASLVTVPGLLLLGIPPQIALATGKLGTTGFKIGSLIKYLQHKIWVKDLVLPMSIISLFGGAIGARLLLELNEEFLGQLIGILLLVFLPFLFLRRGIGTVQKQISKARRLISHFFYFLTRIWGGFFSPGSGFIALFVTLNGYGLTILQAKGTTRIPDLVATLSAVVVFAVAGVIDYFTGTILLLGMFVGGYIGSHVAIKKGDAWIKPIIAIFIVIVSVRLLFF